MAPLPRPPIICYELQTNTNTRRQVGTGHPAVAASRRIPMTGISRKPKVTVIQKDPNELTRARAEPCWQGSEHPKVHYELMEAEPYEYNAHLFSHNQNLKSILVQQNRDRPTHPRRTTPLTDLHKQLLQQPMPAKQPNPHHVRFAYASKLKLDAEEREREVEQRKQEMVMRAQLNQCERDLGSLSRIYKNSMGSIGMSHNAAKYIQRRDEENAILSRKLNRASEVRSRELGQRIQQARRNHDLLQEMEQRKVFTKPKEIPRSVPNHDYNLRHTLGNRINDSLSDSPSTTPTTINNTTSISSSPSTFSSLSSPCSSQHSYDQEQASSVLFIPEHTSKVTIPSRRESKKYHSRACKDNLPQSGLKVSSSTPNKNVTNNNETSNTTHLNDIADKYSFYKRDPRRNYTVLEVTDLDFFDMVEDPTMMEVNELMNEFQTAKAECENLLTIKQQS